MRRAASITSGTGLFLTLWQIHRFGLDYKRAVVLGLLGNIAWDWMPALLAGSLLGGYLGSHFALKKGNRGIKRAFEVVSVLIGAELIFWSARINTNNPERAAKGKYSEVRHIE
jgi:uncharacterized membrane protein YfcA